jgi:hypothetical protein
MERYCFLILFIHQWLYSPLLDPGLFFIIVIFFTQTAGLLGQVISPSHTTTQTQNKRTQKHPCLEWDSNPRSQRSSERRHFMPQTSRTLRSALFSDSFWIHDLRFIFWYMTPCSLVKVNRCCRGICRVHAQDQRVKVNLSLYLT